MVLWLFNAHVWASDGIEDVICYCEWWSSARRRGVFRPTTDPFLGLSLSWREIWSGCDVSGGCVHARLLTSYGRVPEGMLYSTMPL